ncbi:MAG: Stp1/IreP family PP2C-type Ser/Thr phosphatase [Bacteroidia bacterium]
MDLRYRAATASDVGLRRKVNEDRVAHLQLGPQSALFLVCDGMGGHNAGEKAAEIAIHQVYDYFVQHFTEEKFSQGFLEDAIQYANHAIFLASQSHPALHRMGTTLVAAVWLRDHVYYAHIGDSRLYLYRDHHLQSLTKDHSFVQYLIDQGILTPEEAAFHPHRHAILRAMGLEAFAEIEVAPQPLKVQNGDILLLCTDGLTNMVEELAITHILASPQHVEEKATHLISEANRMGGYDNISVVVVEFYGET